MSKRGKPASGETKARLLAQLHGDIAIRQRGYREKALQLLPHVCASCGREFSGGRLKELTVHHRDHDHTHNPPDGSNWELLCLYCHDNEHEKEMTAKFVRTGGNSALQPPREGLANPFDALPSPARKDPGEG